MAKLNLSRIRRQNQSDLRKYERFGIQVFTEALRLQAVPNPSILPMQEAYVKFYQTVFVDAATKEWDRIRVREKAFIPSDFFLNTWREWIKSWVLDNLGELISLVNDNTLKQVKLILGEAIEQGLNPFQTQELLLQEIPDVKRARAIARTESTRANNEGKKKSARDWSNETGQQLFKLWVWGGSRDMREEHFALQNKPIREDQNFIGINGLPMDKPGDISGGAVNTVNCSCTVVYVSERYARRNYPDAFAGQPVRPTPSQDAFRIANTLDEAATIAQDIFNQNTSITVKKALYSSQMTLDQANRYNQHLKNLTSEYNLSPHFTKRFNTTLSFNSTNKEYGYVQASQDHISHINFGNRFDVKNRTKGTIYTDEISGKTKLSFGSQVDEPNVDLSTVTHEFAHVITIEKTKANKLYPQLSDFWTEIDKIKKRYAKEVTELYRTRQVEEFKRVFLGNYAATNNDEFMAEAFTEYKLNSNPSKYAKEVGSLIDKYFKK